MKKDYSIEHDLKMELIKAGYDVPKRYIKIDSCVADYYGESWNITDIRTGTKYYIGYYMEDDNAVVWSENEHFV